VSVAFDRMTIARFRQAFPNARWSEALQVWTVPGKTARRRIDRWLTLEDMRRSPFEEERGRDGYEFEPIYSPYLQVYDRGFKIKTPFSRTVVDELRQIPFARWNGDDKVWEIPFASYDDLKIRWEVIEAAAKRAEPEERQKRANARKGKEAEAKARRWTQERRKRRVPVSSDDLPPVGRAVATAAFGVIILIDVTGEMVCPDEVAEHHPDASDAHVWAEWRAATLEELVHAWPSREAASEHEKIRGWWQPTLEDLREARRMAKSRERREAKKAVSPE
jgi:hypothetical protein